MTGRSDLPAEKEHSDPFPCYHTGKKENGDRRLFTAGADGICHKRYQGSAYSLDSFYKNEKRQCHQRDTKPKYADYRLHIFGW